VALVTGGNSGIGLATAEAFVREGARVAVTGRDEATLAAALASLRGAAASRGGDTGEVLAERADVTRMEDLDRVMDAAGRAFGRIDVLFVNAGIGAFAPLEHATEEHFDALFGVNVKGAYFTVQKTLPLLAPGASVIFTGSANGRVGMPGASVYSATKAALRSLARTLSADLGERGVRVNILSPGPVHTPIYDRLGLAAEALEATRAGIAAMVPLGRFGEPREIAAAAVFLASDESSFFVGAELVADGGLSQL
jgi:NAD(P)-dependent dehydrogenase (short-subunit alcohol dehydrogenase family)